MDFLQVSPIYDNIWVSESIFDHIDPTVARMGFAPHVTSSKVNIATELIPSNNVQDLFWELSFIYDIYQFVKKYTGT